MAKNFLSLMSKARLRRVRLDFLRVTNKKCTNRRVKSDMVSINFMGRICSLSTLNFNRGIL
jgi:hypothetical protein